MLILFSVLMHLSPILCKRTDFGVHSVAEVAESFCWVVGFGCGCFVVFFGFGQ